MVEITKENGRILAPLFSWTDETLVLTYTQGHMGFGWADSAKNLTCAKLGAGDFYFAAGDASSKAAPEVVRATQKGKENSVTIIMPQNAEWAALIEAGYQDVKKITRYDFEKTGNNFNIDKLKSLAAKIPAGYEIKQIDDALYARVVANQNLVDLCGNFENANDFAARGLGFCAVHGGLPVAGASSYTIYTGGLEIEVDTLEAHRKQGLAAACGAAFILECLKRGLTPSWDAANQTSVRLAQKLGFRLRGKYTAYLVKNPRPL